MSVIVDAFWKYRTSWRLLRSLYRSRAFRVISTRRTERAAEGATRTYMPSHIGDANTQGKEGRGLASRRLFLCPEFLRPPEAATGFSMMCFGGSPVSELNPSR